MKKILIFLVMLTFSIVGFAQSSEPEKAMPMTDTEIVRKCSILDIEGKYYKDVRVTIKSNNPEFILRDSKVKVIVTDSFGNKVWNKTFKNAYLYVYSKGQIQIGKPNFNQMVIDKDTTSEEWMGVIREKEGLY